MSLKLMYITNRCDIAEIAENAGVDRIFVDMEYIGKDLRQGGMDTVQSHHTLSDVKNIRKTLKSAELLVRCNPIHNKTESYCSSEEEIDGIVNSGADIIMLPYFKTAYEVEKFIACVGKRTKTVLLFETPESIENIDEILGIEGIDEVYIGLNDLSLGYNKTFMFELLADGTVDKISKKFKEKNLPFGFGGIAAVGKGMVPAERIIMEHYRLGSTCAILSRSFCDTKYISDAEEIKSVFTDGIREIRDVEKKNDGNPEILEENKKLLKEAVDKVVRL